MNAVSKHVYIENFEKIFEWYRQNVHRADEDLYTYNIIELPDTHYKMVDIVRDQTEGIYFRVILKATYEDITKVPVPIKDYRDLGYFFNTKPAISHVTGTQVCIAQLNEDNYPINATLFTYSPMDEKYHHFPL